MLRRSRADRDRRGCWRLVTAIVLTAALTSLTGPVAHAQPPPEPAIAVGAGVCAIAGSMSEQFSPAVGALPSSVTASVDGTGTCAGVGLVGTITLNITTSALLSCAGGEGSFGGNVFFASGFPPFTSVTGLYVGAPGSEVLYISGPGFSAVATLAWSPTATATCALTGVGSTPLYGSVVYVYE